MKITFLIISVLAGLFAYGFDKPNEGINTQSSDAHVSTSAHQQRGLKGLVGKIKTVAIPKQIGSIEKTFLRIVGILLGTGLFFILLRVAGAIAWSWFWVLFPLMLLGVFILLCFFVLILLMRAFKKT